MHRTTLRVAAASVLMVGALAGTAAALTTAHATTVFSACEKHSTKAVSDIVAGLSARCAAGFTKVTWNAAGPRGAVGPRGVVGPRGATGSVGATGIGLDGLFGSGADGNATVLSGTRSLSRDTYVNNLSISSGATLETNGYRLFVAGTLTLAGTAVIENNGGASTTGGGPGAPSGTLGGGQIGAYVSNAGAWTNMLGGQGGAGPIVASPTVGTLPSPSVGGPQVFDAAETAITGRALDGSLINGGVGGGDNGCGGGGGGGVVVVVAESVVHTGQGTSEIEALGGTGVNGSCGGTGGGGGGGGVVVMISTTPQVAGVVLNASGGAGDSGNNGGSTGLTEWLG